MATRKKNDLRARIDPYLTPNNIVIGVVILALVGISFFLILRNIFSGTGDTLITKDQIRIQKGSEVITINNNGLIEYKNGDEVSYKIWSEDKVSSFFATMETKAREYLTNPPKNIDSCYLVSLYLDGELVTVCISDDDEDIKAVFDEFSDDDELADISLEDFFEGTETPTPTPGDGSISDFFNTTPTPTPTPIPTGGNGGPGDDGYLPVKADCESWEEQIVGGHAVISNTLCSVQPE